MRCANHPLPLHRYRDGADAGRFARGAPHRGDQVDRRASYQRHYAGQARRHTLYAARERAGLMLMIYPLPPLGLNRMGDCPELAAVPAFPPETAFAAGSLMTLGPDGAPAIQRD